VNGMSCIDDIRLAMSYRKKTAYITIDLRKRRGMCKMTGNAECRMKNEKFQLLILHSAFCTPSRLLFPVICAIYMLQVSIKAILPVNFTGKTDDLSWECRLSCLEMLYSHPLKFPEYTSVYRVIALVASRKTDSHEALSGIFNWLR